MKLLSAKYITALVLAAMSCVLLSCKGVSRDADVKDIALPETLAGSQTVKSFYPPSKVLKKFARKNPSCPIWSDWQSLCSYVDDDGTILCHDDPSFRAEPSAIFCATNIDLRKTTSKQRDSLQRFCSLPQTIDVRYDDELIKRADACMEYEYERPFSGRDISSLNHGWCNVWRTDKGLMTCEGYEDKTLSSGKKLSEFSDFTCKEAIAEKISFESANCIQWSGTVPCAEPVFAADSLRYSEYSIESDDPNLGLGIMLALSRVGPHLPLPVPTSSFYCSNDINYRGHTTPSFIKP